MRVVALCAGYNSQCLALEQLKRENPDFDYELVAWSEFDPMSKTPLEKQPAVMAHNALFPQWADRNLGDMTKIDWTQVPDFDLLFYSTPCFVAGTLIHTSNGFKPIESIVKGDKVLTHKNSYKDVITTMRHIHKGDLIKIKAMSCGEIICTPEHPFYVRKKYRYGHEWKRAFKSPEWIDAKNLCKGDYKTADYLGMAINQKAEFPVWNGTIDNRWGHGRPVNTLIDKFATKEFWYLMGRYVGDGWKKHTRTSAGIIICCSNRNEDSLVECLDKLGINYTKVTERTVYKYQISSKELNSFVDRYGYKAYGKRIDEETINLPKEQLTSFMDGLLDSDGTRNGNYYKITTTSRELAYGIAQCVAKVYNQPPKIYFTKRPKTTVIENRVVNQHDTYQVCWKTIACIQDNAFYEDGYCWYPIQSIEVLHNQEVEVYNMEVEEDNSYTANGAIVHNCQSISQAGLQHGFTEGSGTRSSIIWNVRDALKIKKPKYACLENVAAMVSAKFLPMFNLWQDAVRAIGYENFAQILNAKHYGVPQNRERIFLMSIRDDVAQHYNFPEKIPLHHTLPEMLEDTVDTRYYLNPVKVNQFVQDNLPMIEKYMDESNEPIEPLPDHLREFLAKAAESSESEEQNDNES